MVTLIIIPSMVMASSNTVVPGTQWHDTNNQLIQAHGGGMIQVGNTYYWFGEDKTADTTIGYFKGVNVYSMTDMVNFTFVNQALSPQASGDLTSSRILERPKVIFNSTTNKYVMYMHIDNTGYGDAKVGVATLQDSRYVWLPLIIKNNNISYGWFDSWGLDVPSASITSGTQLIQWGSNGNANQQWSLQSTGSGYFKMMNFNSLKPMEVSGNSTSAGAKITQWDDLLANNQQWSLVLVP